jgi:predicted nucleotide-binding protein
MAKPKLFIGSSKTNIEVARLIAHRLERDGCAEVTIWDEGVFSLNQGFLEDCCAFSANSISQC